MARSWSPRGGPVKRVATASSACPRCYRNGLRSDVDTDTRPPTYIFTCTCGHRWVQPKTLADAHGRYLNVGRAQPGKGD